MERFTDYVNLSISPPPPMSTRINIIQEFDAPGSGPAGLAWDGSNLWHADYGDGRIYALDPTTTAVRRALYCPGKLSGLAWDGQSLWQSLYDQEMVRRIDPATNDFDAALILEGQGWLSGVAWDGRNLWTVAQQHGRLLALDQDSGRVMKTLPVPVGTGDIDFHDGSLWASVAEPLRYDMALARFEWAADNLEYAILRLNPADGQVINRYAAAHLYSGLCWAGDALWLAHSGGRLYRAELA